MEHAERDLGFKREERGSESNEWNHRGTVFYFVLLTFMLLQSPCSTPQSLLYVEDKNRIIEGEYYAEPLSSTSRSQSIL